MRPEIIILLAFLLLIGAAAIAVGVEDYSWRIAPGQASP